MMEPVDLLRSAPLSPLADDAFELLLALADDEFVVGHRYSEWLGLSPFLEEDLTLTSIAQDELGHARSLYALIWPDWVDRDAQVVRRPALQWRSCGFVERPNAGWEDALMRHYLYDLAEEHRWHGLAERFGSSVEGLVELAEKALREERFHRKHATELVERLCDTEIGRSRLAGAYERFSADAPALELGMNAIDRFKYRADIADAYWHGQRSGTPRDDFSDSGDERALIESRRTRHLGFVTVEQSILDVVRFDPTASW